MKRNKIHVSVFLKVVKLNPSITWGDMTVKLKCLLIGYCVLLDD